jgi:hypothetical protein
MRTPERSGGGRRPGLLSTRGGEGHSGVEDGLCTHGDLLEQQVVADIVEGGERHGLLDVEKHKIRSEQQHEQKAWHERSCEDGE